MGCDIHMTLERKIGDAWHCVWDGDVRTRMKDDGQWEQPIVLNRNYHFFSVLAGVRGDGPDPKGLPADTSPVTRFMVDHWGVDGHSHSWDTLRDFCRKWAYPDREEEAIALVKEKLVDDDGEIHAVAENLFCIDVGRVDDYRVIYWFDN